MDNKFIVFGAPSIGEEEIEEVVATLRSSWLGTGPRVARFEEEFADGHGVSSSRVAAVNSGTAALHLALLACDVGPGDEVIAPAMTFCSSINAIIHTGATPVLADVDPISMTLDPEDVARKISKKTRALLPVHYAGHSCDMSALMRIANKYNLKVVEDCAHAIESTYEGQPLGTIGDFGCFSFYVTKNATTGEGGMVIAKSDADIHDIKVLALHGMSKDAWRRYSDSGYKHYDVVAAGFKYNMTDIQAAIGIHQHRKIEKNVLKRIALWELYDGAFKALPVRLPPVGDIRSNHARHLYHILIDKDKLNGRFNRDMFLDAMTKAGIGVGVHYRSIASHIFYRDKYGYRDEDYPVSKKIGEQTVSIPLSAAVTTQQAQRIVREVSNTLLANIADNSAP